MTALEKIREWIKEYPGYDDLREFSVDYTEATPANGGLMPVGLTELRRDEDILGNVTITNQYSFTLYFVFTKSPGDDAGAEYNAQWIMNFQSWVQERAARRQTPIFGDDVKKEIIRAQNGTLLGANEEGTAVYTVQLTVQFIKFYENE